MCSKFPELQGLILLCIGIFKVERRNSYQLAHVLKIQVIARLGCTVREDFFIVERRYTTQLVHELEIQEIARLGSAVHADLEETAEIQYSTDLFAQGFQNCEAWQYSACRS